MVEDQFYGFPGCFKDSQKRVNYFPYDPYKPSGDPYHGGKRLMQDPLQKLYDVIRPDKRDQDHCDPAPKPQFTSAHCALSRSAITDARAVSILVWMPSGLLVPLRIIEMYDLVTPITFARSS